MSSGFSEFKNLTREMVGFVKERKAYYLAPIIFLLLLLGSIFFVLEGSVFAPFIYAIF